MNLGFKHYILALGVLTLDTTNAEKHHISSRNLQRIPGPAKILNSTGSDRRRLQNSLEEADLTTLTPLDLVQKIIGPDVAVSNIVYTGAEIASGTFTGGTGIIGFEAGIVLTSGSIANTIGPNIYDDVSKDNDLPGDSDLDVLVSPYISLDASILEFDFECEGIENIHFEYVFSSEEYNEFVDSEFNDVFGFFLNDANVALIPGTTTPVAINNVNCGMPYAPSKETHCKLYNNNDLQDGGPFFNTEMDGFTQVLLVDAPMNAGVNHIKLAIADVGDRIFDSAVFIKAGSFSCVTLEPSPKPTPKPTSEPTPEPQLPVIGGDPHIKTWSNKLYDFHGICDLVLLQNPDFQDGLGMDIHVRTKQIKQFSYVSSTVLCIGGDILEVMGDVRENVFWINKQPNRNVDNGIIGVVSGYPVSYQKINSKQHEFTTIIGDRESIIITTFKAFVRVSIHGATEESFGTSLGLLGSYGSGKMIARDNSTVIEDTNAFGQEWQVLPLDGMLFHNVEGPQAPKKCRIPLASDLRRRLAESNISEEEAEIVCAHVLPSNFDMCVFDAMATGDKDAAGAY